MRLLKHLHYACLLFAAAACLSACESPAAQLQPEQPQPGQSPPEQPTLQADAPAVYYNDYLGLSISMPPSWHINALSDNLSAWQGETATPHLIEYGGGSSRLELIDMQNTATSRDANHSRFCAYAELYSEAVEPAQYAELLISLLEADGNGFTYTLLKQEQIPLALHTAERICVQVSSSANPDSTEQANEQVYMEEYYIVALEQAFVVFYINYWPQNEQSRAAAFAVLEGITLPNI